MLTLLFHMKKKINRDVVIKDLNMIQLLERSESGGE